MADTGSSIASPSVAATSVEKPEEKSAVEQEVRETTAAIRMKCLVFIILSK